MKTQTSILRRVAFSALMITLSVSLLRAKSTNEVNESIDRLAGVWEAADPDASHIVAIEISKEDNGWFINKWTGHSSSAYEQGERPLEIVFRSDSRGILERGMSIEEEQNRRIYTTVEWVCDVHGEDNFDQIILRETNIYEPSLGHKSRSRGGTYALKRADEKIFDEILRPFSEMSENEESVMNRFLLDKRVDLKRAFEVLTESVDPESCSDHMNFKIAMSYSFHEKYDQAIEHLEHAARKAPLNIQVRRALGRNYYKVEEYEKMVHHLARVCNESERSQKNDWWLLSYGYSALGKEEEASVATANYTRLKEASEL